MKRRIHFLASIVLLVGCSGLQQPSVPVVTSTPQAAAQESVWSVYDLDPAHPWNRVFRQLYRRTTQDGTEYGFDELDPLLWFDTTYLLEEPSHQQTIQVLDEFLSTDAETLIHDSLRRAMFQRDLWAVFDWLASQDEPYSFQRRALQTRLAQIIRRVALSKEEIASLPDNYALEVAAHTHPAHVSVDDPEAAFLPADVFQPDGAWVPLGREGGPVAMTHTEAAPFFGRSVFLVFARFPEGRSGTLRFIESLNHEKNPVTTTGSEVALVRRMLLIDDQGDLVLSPLVETIQIRHFAPRQHFHEFELNRTRLLKSIQGGGLVPNDAFFMLFMSHGDVFENPNIPTRQAAIPDICMACHFESTTMFDSGNTASIISYSRQSFRLPDQTQPVLFPTTLEAEAETVIQWKRSHATWSRLATLWKQTSP
jgi:hypothetical protein